MKENCPLSGASSTMVLLCSGTSKIGLLTYICVNWYNGWKVEKIITPSAAETRNSDFRGTTRGNHEGRLRWTPREGPGGGWGPPADLQT